MVAAQEALQRLKDGNRRFRDGQPAGPRLSSQERREELVADQNPFAIILGCADSRVPGEIVFDQGLGDLFVIRVAGNVVAPSQIGSIEFAVEWFGTSLVVVLGHTRCGAIAATVDALRGGSGHRAQYLNSIVDRVRPAVEPLLANADNRDEEELMRDCVRANVHASVKHLRQGSSLLEELAESGDLMIIGAEYSLETGSVEFLDD
ncbi:carbonic anhydrase [Halieaceae bacterium IMCC14734]|uniref:Carbonic anhydrase n=1 Tax=Candidatus Litorirhabdus singularis TaxID=2518993 RepID=A0ABT3TJX8_9GAMM|nr:carbonic anhydrase [Candidatus Litorirhabdus singularis]MCX2982309.1 carbonic anhydrase [Candidatus Litorirhabdus singularis]